MADKKVKSKAQLQTEANAQEIKTNGFLNPLSKGVTYDAFLAELKDKTVKAYCKGTLAKHELEALEVELINHKNNK